MADFRGFVANCLLCGHETTPDPEGVLIPNLITWNLNGYRVELHQHPDVIREKPQAFKNQFVRSTEVIVNDVTDSNVEKVRNLVNDLCSLLSFASLSNVWCFASNYSGRTEGKSLWGKASYSRPTIDIRNGQIVHNFIEQTWPNYQKLKKRRKLQLVFRYLVEVHLEEQPVEIQLLLIFTALECLKDTFAKEQRIPYARGFYRKISNPPKTDIAKEPTYKFEELLTLMLREQKIRKGLKRSIQLRNDIIHSGVSRRPMRSLFKTRRECDELVTIYLLKLLGYRGWYLCRTGLDRKKLG